METGSRYDLIFDFSGLQDQRIIMENIAGDTPFGFSFGDDLDPEEDVFENRQTDRVMAFDVGGGPSVMDGFNAALINQYSVNGNGVDRVRKVALFEGTDEHGRLQPLLGTAEPATDYLGNPVNWPATPEYTAAGLVGQMEGAIAWHSRTTENPALDSTEEWHVANVTGDAHPVHLHLVHFDVLGRHEIIWDSATNEDDRVLDPAGVTAPAPNGDGTYLVNQPVVQHNGLLGSGFRVANLTYDPNTTVDPNDGGAGPYVENGPKDMVSALPGQVTVIKATFDKPGRYVWHCHILSHEDHEMMRVLHVGPGA
jgi:FtsP/CotA-like multicopper oxidase with cupredoxin domain